MSLGPRFLITLCLCAHNPSPLTSFCPMPTKRGEKSLDDGDAGSDSLVGTKTCVIRAVRKSREKRGRGLGKGEDAIP